MDWIYDNPSSARVLALLASSSPPSSLVLGPSPDQEEDLCFDLECFETHSKHNTDTDIQCQGAYFSLVSSPASLTGPSDRRSRASIRRFYARCLSRVWTVTSDHRSRTSIRFVRRRRVRSVCTAPSDQSSRAGFRLLVCLRLDNRHLFHRCLWIGRRKIVVR